MQEGTHGSSDELRAHLLFYSKQLDDVLVVELLQHLKLPHLHIQGA